MQHMSLFDAVAERKQAALRISNIVDYVEKFRCISNLSYPEQLLKSIAIIFCFGFKTSAETICFDYPIHQDHTKALFN